MLAGKYISAPNGVIVTAHGGPQCFTEVHGSSWRLGIASIYCLIRTVIVSAVLPQILNFCVLLPHTLARIHVHVLEKWDVDMSGKLDMLKFSKLS